MGTHETGPVTPATEQDDGKFPERRISPISRSHPTHRNMVVTTLTPETTKTELTAKTAQVDTIAPFVAAADPETVQMRCPGGLTQGQR